MKRIISFLLILLLSFSLISCSNIDLEHEDNYDSVNIEENLSEENVNEEAINEVKEDGYYTSKEEVSLYIKTYDKLPENYITKKEAAKLGWESNKGNLWDVTDKKSIGGDKFGNREGKLPVGENRQYFECDINYEGGFRGPERLVYSNDGLIYYTEDHYDTFILLYGDE